MPIRGMSRRAVEFSGLFAYFQFMHQREYWVFDLDGTLVESFSPFLADMEAEFRRVGRDFTDDDKVEMLHSSLAEYFPKIFGDDGITVLEKVLKQGNEAVHKFPLYPEVRELLIDLKAKGARLAIWTARNTDSAKAILAHHQITEFFDHIVGRDDVAKQKPDSEGLQKILNAWNISGEDIVMVGDHDHDMEGGASTMAMTIRAGWGFHCRHLRREISEHHVFDCSKKFRATVTIRPSTR